MGGRVWLVTASIYVLDNLWGFRVKGDLEDVERIIVVDEGDERVRQESLKMLKGLDIEFHGPREREAFFRSRYGSSYEKYLSLIPERSHAETSYGFLLAYEAGADYIIEIDDDVYPEQGYSLVKDHLSSLANSNGVGIESPGRWINTVDFLELRPSMSLFPRGHPYDPSTRVGNYNHSVQDAECVLNMGLWTGHPDLDALTILYLGGMDGRAPVESVGIKEERVIPLPGNYFAVCSMNTSFSRKIVPAFYQLYMRYMGIDRFDDIWSGIIIKKIADSIGDRICFGKPAARHVKRPRPVWKDLRAELEGMIINEILWRIIDHADISSKSYQDAYLEIANHIERSLGEFKEELHRKFIATQVEKMRIWIDAIDKL
ncbi:hypothetical protein ATG_11480 [Desulfurococcaceae archaeon AG1]|jgi:hypothetical protein|nr:hypothetical protein ATG_11480 [Desulfurococcaceae archaeon AG1]